MGLPYTPPISVGYFLKFILMKRPSMADGYLAGQLFHSKRILQPFPIQGCSITRSCEFGLSSFDLLMAVKTL